MLFISAWTKILRSSRRNRVNWLYKSIRSTVFDLAVSLFVLILTWSKGDWGTLVTLLLDCILECVLFKSSVLLVMSRADARLLRFNRTAGIDVSLSVLLFGKMDTWLVVTRANGNSWAGFSLHSYNVSFRLISKPSDFFVLTRPRASWVGRRNLLHWLNDSLGSSILDLPISYFMFVGSWSQCDS
jgi:hypothetical protein